MGDEGKGSKKGMGRNGELKGSRKDRREKG